MMYFIKSLFLILLFFSLYPFHSYCENGNNNLNNLKLKALGYKNLGKVDSNIIILKNILDLYEAQHDCYHAAKTAMSIGTKTGTRTNNLSEAIIYLARASNYYPCHKNDSLQSKVLNNLGNAYAYKNDYNNAHKNYRNAYRFSESTLDSNMQLIIAKNIAYTYSQVGEFQEALNIYMESVHLAQRLNDISAEIDANINIGILYEKTNQIDKSFFHYDRVIELWKKNSFKNHEIIINVAAALYSTHQYARTNEIYKTLLKKEDLPPRAKIKALHGLGNIHLKKLNYDSAYYYLNKGLNKALEVNAFYEEIQLKITLSEVFISEKDFERAKKILSEVIQTTISKQLLEQNRKAEHLMSIANAKLNNYEEAYLHFVNYSKLNDSLMHLENVESINKIQHKYALKIEKQNAENNAIKTEIKTKTEYFKQLIFYGILGTLILIIVFLTISRNREKKLFKAKKLLDKIEKEQLLNKQKHNEQVLIEYLKNIEEKKRLINSLEDQLKLLDTDKVIYKDQLFGTKILTEDDWEEFKFEQAYNGFMGNLRKKVPDLTKSEERLFILMKLNFQSKEIADMLGISVDSVKKYRHRLRKKIGISADVKLDLFIKTFT